jgi:hypothetical protein
MRVLSLAALALVGFGVSSQPFSCFPRMRDQASIKPFEKEMPEVPANQVPFAGPNPLPLTEAEAARLANPVKPTADTISLGGIYYGYYCLMCHGQSGRGEGPVGQSYVPAPTDLTSPKMQGLADGALARAMVLGSGHEPVLESTVPLERRWYIIHYLRSLRASRSPQAGAPSR